MDQFLENNPQYANFAQKNKSIYHNWKSILWERDGIVVSAVANSFNAQIEGRVEEDDYTIDISTNRQLHSSEHALWPTMQPISELTFVSYDWETKLPSISIQQKSFWGGIGQLFSFGMERYPYPNSNYAVSTADIVTTQALLEIPFVNEWIKEKKLVKLKLKGRKLKLFLRKVFIDENEVHALLDALQEIANT